MKWFRFYHEALDDPKVQLLSDRRYRQWVNLLCLANQGTPRGTLPDVAGIAFRLRLAVDKAGEMLSDLEKSGLIDVDAAGGVHPHNWNSRQRASDNVATRVTEHRERNAPSIESNVTETPDVTLPVTPLKRSSRVGAPAIARPCSDPDTDTDTDTEKKGTRAVARPSDDTKPFDVFTEGCALTGTETAEITGKARTRQLGYISEALRDYTSGDIIGCLGWLMSDDWRRGRGVDYKTVLDNLPKWKLAGKPESVRAASARAPTIDDIKNAALRSILTVDLSDITEEPIRDPRRRLSSTNSTPSGIAPGERHIDGGERLSAPDVLPSVARPGAAGL